MFSNKKTRQATHNQFPVIKSFFLFLIFPQTVKHFHITKIIWIIKTIVECTVDRQRLL